MSYVAQSGMDRANQAQSLYRYIRNPDGSWQKVRRVNTAFENSTDLVRQNMKSHGVYTSRQAALNSQSSMRAMIYAGIFSNVQHDDYISLISSDGEEFDVKIDDATQVFGISASELFHGIATGCSSVSFDAFINGCSKFAHIQSQYADKLGNVFGQAATMIQTGQWCRSHADNDHTPVADNDAVEATLENDEIAA